MSAILTHDVRLLLIHYLGSQVQRLAFGITQSDCVYPIGPQPNMGISTTTRYVNPNHMLLSLENDYEMV